MLLIFYYVSIYFGMRLTVYVKDPDMIKQITVTEFDNFIDRPVSAIVLLLLHHI